MQRSCARAFRSDLDDLKNEETDEFIASLDLIEAYQLLYDWAVWARDDQLPPVTEAPWRIWLMLGGRGAGKTRTGAEWVRALITQNKLDKYAQPLRIGLVGETMQDAEAVMVNGVSGLLACHPPHERPQYNASKNQLIWPCGSIGELFTAQKPDGLRGPQFHYVWCDEVAKWPHVKETFDMVQFTLRLGENPQALLTTTPKPLPFLKTLAESTDVITTRASTFENKENLSPAFLKNIKDRYGNRLLGRQELEGEFVEEVEGALWQFEQLQNCRTQDVQFQDLGPLVIAVDPAVTSHKNSDKCGIIIAGLNEEGKAVVMKDATLTSKKPFDWATHIIQYYGFYKADMIIAEVNQGGELIETCLRQIDPNIIFKPVFAKRGKWLRAGPVSTLYEQGKVKHNGDFCALEEEMINFTPRGRTRGKSPDRLDALVMALTYLLIDPKPKPTVRSL